MGTGTLATEAFLRLKFISFHGLFPSHGRAHSPLLVRHNHHRFRHLYSKYIKLISKQQTVSVSNPIKQIMNIWSPLQLLSIVIGSMRIGFSGYCD